MALPRSARRLACPGVVMPTGLPDVGCGLSGHFAVSVLLLQALAAAPRPPGADVQADAAVSVDFGAPAFPPLVQKWGGVEHLDTPGAAEFEAMSNNFARRTPMVLAVEQLGTTMTDTPTVLFRRGTDGSVVPLPLDAARVELRRRRHWGCSWACSRLPPASSR